METAIIERIIFDSLVIVFFVLGVLAGVIGVGLIVCREKMFRLFAAMNRSVSTRKSLKPMSVQRDIEPFIRSHRIWFGIAFIAGAGYSIYSLLAIFSTVTMVNVVVPGPGSDSSFFSLAFVVIEALRWFMLVASVFALAAGIILSFAPSTLRMMEEYANRWYSMRKFTVGVEAEYFTVDKWVEEFPKTAGVAITLGALIVVISSGVILFN